MSDDQRLENGTPYPAATVREKRNRRMLWATRLGELLDNSLDAGATHVEIRFSSKPKPGFTVLDNGRGCADLKHMCVLGDHYTDRARTVGTYGVGFKDVSINVGGTTVITSRHKNVERQIVAPWPRFERTNTWGFEPASVVPDTQRLIQGSEGTLLQFQNIIRELPNVEQYPALVDWIEFHYAPALKGGSIEIEFHKNVPIQRRGETKPKKCRKLALKPFESPPLEHVVEDEFYVNGNFARLRVGIVADGFDNPHPGIAYHFLHRVICVTTHGLRNPDGGGRPGGVGRVFGVLELGDGWPLSTYKNEVVAGQQELAAEIWKRCRGMVAEANQRAHEQKFSGLCAKMSSAVRDADRRVNGRAGTGPGKGRRDHTSGRKPRGGRRGTASKSNRKGSMMSTLVFETSPMGENSPHMEFDLQTPCVFINENSPVNRPLLDTDNWQALTLAGLMGLCVMDQKEKAQLFRDQETGLDAFERYARELSWVEDYEGPAIRGDVA